MRFQFIEGLARIANAKYLDSKVTTSLAEGL